MNEENQTEKNESLRSDSEERSVARESRPSLQSDDYRHESRSSGYTNDRESEGSYRDRYLAGQEGGAPSDSEGGARRRGFVGSSRGNNDDDDFGGAPRRRRMRISETQARDRQPAYDTARESRGDNYRNDNYRSGGDNYRSNDYNNDRGNYGRGSDRGYGRNDRGNFNDYRNNNYSNYQSPRPGGYNRDYDNNNYRNRDDRYDNRNYTPRRNSYNQDGQGASDYGYTNRREEDTQRREYYANRYNEARESNRQAYGDRPMRDNNMRRPQRNNYRNNDGGYGRQDGNYNNNNNNYNQRGGYRQNNGDYRNNRPQRNDRYGQPNNGPRQNNRFNKGRNNNNKKFVPRPQPVVYRDDAFDENEPIRLNKYLANSGVCSRREADEMIQAGLVIVNGAPVTELGTKITMKDDVEVNGKKVKPENKVYVLLNKPRNCVTTTEDPQERLTVMHMVRNACKERINPVGRLDRNTTGVLLLTNDGDLASKLVHPSFKKKKIYHVWLDKEVTVEDMQRIADGVELDDGEMHADAISYATEDDHTQVGIEIHSGRNRIVRRLFESLGYHVYKLDRVYFAGLTKKNLPRGKWRYLTQEEVDMLKMGAFE